METQSEEQAAAEAADSRGEGEPPQVAGAQAARPEDRLTLLLRVRAQTKQQLLEYKSMFDANEEKTPEQIMQEKQIEAKIEELEKEIEEAKVAFEMKKLALDRMQLSSAVKKHLEKINTKTRKLGTWKANCLMLERRDCYAVLSLLWPLLLQSTGSVAIAHGLSRSVARAIFPDRGTNPCPLHRQADSQPLRHQGSPFFTF
ncbi:centromere protein H isoform X4 [Physeter macrocephalus]|uniref:Centromere protein H isoform X4 n=1 Tax=Physeter macrocephalus TaxID=9755 RepID=A0A9W2WTJ1_PHYMC|nr:centromere protein H isoform X4 [Physeter catodon]